MAEILVSALVQTVLSNLNSAVLQEIGLNLGLKDEINALESIFTTVQMVLQEAEANQNKSGPIQYWLGKLKNAAYDAEDILDKITTEGLRRRRNSERGMHRQLISVLSMRDPWLFRLKIARKVKIVRERLDAIAEERLKFHLPETSSVHYRVGESGSRQTSSLVNESEIYGRDVEKETTVEKLISENPNRDDLTVYALWGMGGIGKTTLAQLIYNDERVKSDFELRIWVCVSDDFNIPRIVKAILESIGEGGSATFELDPLQRLLQEKLGGRRFLLVLDDVWNENHIKWDGLRQSLRCGSKGSVAMITTRIEKVALMMATMPIHQIGYLSQDDSWSLFKKRAFAIVEEAENLVAIGKEIVKKCGGVPLAVKALGSLMSFKTSESEWLAIKASEIWHFSEDNGILPALRLSYYNLSPQMRQCFVYCCIFPKDYEMVENELIPLWMANGFLDSEGQSDLYLTGRLIFKELVWRSFLQDVEKNWRGDRTCKMHDLVHDLAESVMRHETSILEHGKVVKHPKTLRHLSLFREDSVKEGKLKLPVTESLRSIIVRERYRWDTKEAFCSLISKQQHLRVLDANYFMIPKLPILVCKLELLRYLIMSCNAIKRLPESLTCLHNLQTLKLLNADTLIELPRRLKYMKNLWFLDIEQCYSLLCTPPGLGELSCLRELSIFIVGQNSDHQINQLKDLNLCGKLSIKGLENVRNLDGAKSANLMTKSNLTSLSLYWKKGIKDISAKQFEDVLEGLQPHQNLERIQIESYQGSRFSNWMSALALQNVTEVILNLCSRCEQLPPLGRLPSLKTLELRGFDSLKRFNVDWHGDGETSFVALTSLTIIDMYNLEEWTIPDSVQSFACLRRLRVQTCPKLVGLPFLPFVEDLSIEGRVLRSIISCTSLIRLEVYDLDDQIDVPPGLFNNHKNLVSLGINFSNTRILSSMWDNLSSLKTLSLNGCSDLEFLPEGFKYLTSLESLDIMSCNSLGSFPAITLESLSSLKSLTFQNCKKLNPLCGPVQRVAALQNLTIVGCPKLEDLPESLQELNALTFLSIYGLNGLCSLPNWIGSLQSLSCIWIWSCINLKSLPDGFQSLKSLRELHITYCHPQLEKRCNKPKGEDWKKISHIPRITINQKIMQSLDL